MVVGMGGDVAELVSWLSWEDMVMGMRYNRLSTAISWGVAWYIMISLVFALLA